MATANKVHKHLFKVQYEKLVKPWVFLEGDLVLVYEQINDTLGARNLYQCGIHFTLTHHMTTWNSGYVFTHHSLPWRTYIST